MKVTTVLFALATATSAHYTFPSLIANGETTDAWTYARQWTGYQSNGPVTNVASVDIRCNVGASTKSALMTMTVAAGSKVGFRLNQPISHVGVMEWYMAKVPEGHTAATWDGSGDVWFKIDEDHPTFSPLKWPSLSMRDHHLAGNHANKTLQQAPRINTLRFLRRYLQANIFFESSTLLSIQLDQRMARSFTSPVVS